MNTIPISELRRSFPGVRAALQTEGALAVTRHGTVVAHLMTPEVHARAWGSARVQGTLSAHDAASLSGAQIADLGRQDLVLTVDDVPVAVLTVPTPSAPRQGRATVVVVANISGGEGKTTLTRELAFEFAARGLRALVIDGDPQASLSKSLGLHVVSEHPERSVMSTLTWEGEGVPPLPTPWHVHGVDVFEACHAMYTLSHDIHVGTSNVRNLRQALTRTPHDVVLIDTPPAPGPLLTALCSAADHLVMPVNSIKGVQNLPELRRVIKAARNVAPAFGVRLLVPNRLRGVALHRELLESLGGLGVAEVSPGVRDAIAVAEAAIYYRPVRDHVPKSEVAADFARVADALAAATGLEMPAGAAL